MKTVSLELAKQLKKNEFPQEADFWWVISLTTNYHLSYTGNDKLLLPRDRNDFFAAPTAEEILELLPERITHRRCLYMTPTAEELLPDENNYYVFYEKASMLGEETGNPEFGGKTLVEALAKMWLYLKENNYV